MEAAGELLWNARMMFYAIPAGEMAENAERWRESGAEPDWINKAIPYFFLMIAAEFLVSLAKNKPVYRANDAMVSVLQGSLQQLVGMWLKFARLSTYVFVYDKVHLFEVDEASWLVWVGCLCGVDFGYYLMHYSAHANVILYSAHSLHHSGEDFNLATALRQGALQQAYSFLFMLPNALVFPPLIFAQHAMLNTLWQFWIHTTLINDLGPLEYIVNTPSAHRVHHLAGHSNCNYAGVLIIWDRMFGTYTAEANVSSKYGYGLVRQYSTFDPLYANVDFFHKLHTSYRPDKKRNLWFYLGLLTATRCKPLKFTPMGLFKPIPTADQGSKRPNRPKYDGDSTSHHLVLKLYALWIFVLSQAATIYVLVVAKGGLSNMELAVVQTLCVALYVSVGRVLDGFSKGRNVNTVRILATLSFASYLAVTPELAGSHNAAVQRLQMVSVIDACLWFVTSVIMKDVPSESVAKKAT